MKLYWPANTIPELADLPKSQQQYLWSRCHIHAYRYWETWAALLLFAVFGFTGTIIGVVFLRILHSILAPGSIIAILISAIPALILAFIGYIIYYNALVQKIRPYIQEYRSQYYDGE
jgi:hypothetical protein